MKADHAPPAPAISRRSGRSTAPPRVGIYDPARSPGGPSRYVAGLLDRIDPEEFEVVLFAHPRGPHAGRPLALVPCLEGDRPPAAGAASGVAVARGRAPRWPVRLVPGPIRLWAGFGADCRRLAARFREGRVDLLHTNNTGCEESAVAARLAGVPRVLGTFHVDSSYDLRLERSGPAHRALELLSNHCLHRAIAVSRATGRDWVRRTRLPASRVVAIPNGLDPGAYRRRLGPAEARRRLGLPVAGLVVGGVGRLDEAKGFATLIEAVALLVGEHPGLALAIAGEGPLRAALTARAEALGLADRVHWLGFRAEVGAVLEALDVFALPSLCEAMPYALLEAMAMGLPAVASEVGGVPEVVVRGVTGAIVPRGDPAALASALRPLLASATLRERMGRASAERVASAFDERETARRTFDVYREMLAHRPGRSFTP